MHRVSAVIEHPVVTRVVNIFLCLCTSIDNAELGRSGNKKHWRFISRAFSVRVNEVNEGWDPGQVDDLVVALETAWGFI
jgi:hypothetical protein